MKFMHLADAHLDSPFQGLSFLPSNEFNNIKQSTQKSFTKAIDTALDQKVDLVLMYQEEDVKAVLEMVY